MNTAKTKKTKNAAESETPQPDKSELKQKRWAVVSYEAVAAFDLTYDEALKTIAELQNRKVSGLCIVTNEAAAKASSKK